ncbi:YitT family protein [Bacillus chungangensis]|uniref:Uncharacterized membrane-anchored protein YitT (DUF2179 family) n=1 Tax=Bacillus chungangensis TaxID=587633 RepID=A0ABT9WNI0_9BACI|nr:YitT family protein [Bacillus chungangensis]MDQ0174664.1 uncharacterized membrane-anchored protein YitT (DUF2179 family) [Bacillus chungangensis]
MKENLVFEHGKKIIVVFIGALLNAIGMNLFLIPANVYASGFAGAAQLLANLFTDFTPMKMSTGILLAILNIPVAILGWKKVGRSFTVYSIISVALMSLFLELVPIEAQSPDIILNAVFGGVIAAIGIGMTLRVGASTGGMDIVALVLSKMKGRSVGTYFFIMNAVIIITAGAVYGWEKALYTLVTLYVSTRVIDTIHTRHQKHTAMIITKKTEELKKAIHDKMVRGITVVPAKGAFSNEEKEMMIIVLTRYELYDLERIIKEIDPHAFTNIVQTTGILGFFRKD